MGKNVDIAKKELTKKITVCMISIVALLGIMLCVFGLYYHSLKEKISSQTYEALKKSGDQSMALLHLKIKDGKDCLKILAQFCDEPDNTGYENWRSIIAKYNLPDFRMGVADLNGMIYFGEGRSMDISDRDYYRQAIEQEKLALDFVEDAFDGSDSVILASPFYAGRAKVRGVLCLEYSTQGLGQLLNEGIDKERGAALAIRKNGQVMAGYQGMEQFATFYEMMEQRGYLARNEVMELRASIEKEESGYFNYNFKGKPSLMYYQPAGIEDWVLISMTVTENYQKAMENIQRESMLLALAEILAGSGIFVLIILIVRLHKEETEKHERDFLTDIYNREKAKDILEEQLKKHGAVRFGCCFFLDVDNFKQINDTKGHDAGDKVLANVAAVLKKEMHKQDIISRFGGDEFCIWMWGVTENEKAGRIAKQLLESLYSAEGVEMSLGITFFAKPGDTYSTIIKRADQGLYKAKSLGKNQFAIIE